MVHIYQFGFSLYHLTSSDLIDVIIVIDNLYNDLESDNYAFGIILKLQLHLTICSKQDIFYKYFTYI